MKKMTLLFTFFSFTLLHAQIPTGYYDQATGSGYELKNNLSTIITRNYNQKTYNDLWTLYGNNAFKDQWYENDMTIMDIYSENPSGSDPYNFTYNTDKCGSYRVEGDCYNREHIIAQSFFNEALPMKSDAHHIFPTDGKVNGERGNLPFGEILTANYSSRNGTKRGSNKISDLSSFSGVVFEPINEFKGDVARAFFYFATRYQKQIPTFKNNYSNSQVSVMFDGSTTQTLDSNFLKTLIKWHIQDPVSTKEIAQNNAIYDHQRNRNPYIDTPDYVRQVWTAAYEAVQETLETAAFELETLSIYPNPTTTGYINISNASPINHVDIYAVNGQWIASYEMNENQITLDVTKLNAGFYILVIEGPHAKTMKKFIKN